MRFVSDRLKAKAQAEDSAENPRPGVVRSTGATGDEFFEGLDLALARAQLSHCDWNVDPEEVVGDSATKPLPERPPLPLNGAAPDAVLAVAEKEAKREKDARLGGWFGLPRQQLTPQMRNELRILKLKPYMDPMKFMERLDSKKLPTHFHIGVEVGGGKVRAIRLLEDSTVQAWTRRRLSEAQTLAKLRAPYKVKRKSKAAKNSWKKRK
ncbi:conserved hypothetical protein [Perkinsus marinus ATCC 50983]|uniref:Fcf2 pre-rRNA processing C-terminal domain-containing protein n=1 Tax=Perkinsus marinus (strain ATCC 50983 / TXsc) TaxID=423536 RepID=C5KB27_PERM5|nr:conserved hypothetical protein [Perkinsus marinus ATCC 50983]EER18353.1 conserved hypothetical protein [Perkinsus marinus ATCC 50983]|eukprot:XP_002786557.1 conserved hypothetical protein [Perkinsus marinus ATCC 50983]